MVITALVIIVIIVLIVYLVSKQKQLPPVKPKIGMPVIPVGIHCEKCGSDDFRFLWDKQIIADDKHLEVTPSGFSNRTSQYGGTSSGFSHGWSANGILGFGGHPRAHYGANRGVHNGSSSSHSESYRYKEVHVKSFRISCKCKRCGSVWKEDVSEDAYPEVKKIPTMK